MTKLTDSFQAKLDIYAADGNAVTQMMNIFKYQFWSFLMSNIDTSNCEAHSKAQVGEAGTSASMEQTVSEAVTKRFALQNIETDLCGSHAVVGMLVVDGKVTAIGDISKKGDGIETKVEKGQTVIAIALASPVPSGIVCIRLGNATVSLFDCGLAQ